MSSNVDVTKGENSLDLVKPMFPISVVAELLGVHQRTLRIYDEEGLLTPSRSPKNRRLYSYNEIEKGKFIQYLTREAGINLAGVRIISHLLKKQGVEPSGYISFLKNVMKDIDKE